MGRPPFATAPVTGLAVLLAGLLLAVSGRYGYHRDELHFLRAGREAAFGYVDQPPLTPCSRLRWTRWCPAPWSRCAYPPRWRRPASSC